MTAQVQDPRTGKYRRMNQEDAIAYLNAHLTLVRWFSIVLRAIIWLAVVIYFWGVIEAVGLHALWGVGGGLLMALAWRTK